MGERKRETEKREIDREKCDECEHFVVHVSFEVFDLFVLNIT